MFCTYAARPCANVVGTIQVLPDNLNEELFLSLSNCGNQMHVGQHLAMAGFDAHGRLVVTAPASYMRIRRAALGVYFFSVLSEAWEACRNSAL
jgi:hypothetical protein